jgi:hypothetical protein
LIDNPTELLFVLLLFELDVAFPIGEVPLVMGELLIVTLYGFVTNELFVPTVTNQSVMTPLDETFCVTH